MGTVFGVILGMVFLFVWASSSLKQRDERWQKEYAVWVKYTGNPQQLTFEEFQTLRPNLLRSK